MPLVLNVNKAVINALIRYMIVSLTDLMKSLISLALVIVIKKHRVAGAIRGAKSQRIEEIG
ncbi:hypothetical protein [Pantoea ananatis]|uniref:hypothetical protein n=1 Tax=Pantoea ananas TaxID=553 RepID=UPI0013032B86|nr:hypothetical protein [Pantoea ananatis]